MADTPFGRPAQEAGDLTLEELDAEIRRIREGTPTGDVAELDAALREAGVTDSRTAELVELDAALAKVRENGGRDPEEEARTPWRARLPWDSREAYDALETQVVGLWSSRHGQSPEMARRALQAELREAWWNPGGFGSTDDRMDAVAAAMEAARTRLKAMSPIAPSGAANVREVKR